MDYHGLRTLAALKLQWKSFFDGDLKAVKAKGVHGQISSSPFRSVCWKMFLGVMPDTSLMAWPAALAARREEFTTLKKRYVSDLQAHMQSERDLALNNPLSQEDTSPWKRFFEDNQLQKTIQQDVERTFPDNDFFRTDLVQQQLTDILFIYCRENESVSYRQGMHELLALIYLVVDSDKVADSPQPTDETDTLILDIMSPDFVQHDAYCIFAALLDTMRPWFDSGSTEPSESQSQDQQVLFNSARAQQNTSKTTAVMKKCHHIQYELLKQYDPELEKRLNTLGIEPQLYGIRWLRLLFAREFHMQDVLRLWDAIFADDAHLAIVDYMALAMLLFLREHLLAGDYMSCLSRLMRFPPVEDVLSIFERAHQIRELPDKRKPVPINGPIQRLAPDRFVQTQPTRPVPSVPQSSPTSPQPSASQSTSSLKKPRNPFSRPSANNTPSREDSPVSAAAAHVRLLEDELDQMRTMNSLLAERMDKGISLMSRLLGDATTENPIDMTRVRIALAAIKQVRDILRGELLFDEAVLHSNETAFVTAEADDSAHLLSDEPGFSSSPRIGLDGNVISEGEAGGMTERERAELERLEREHEESRRAEAERLRLEAEEEARQEAIRREEQERLDAIRREEEKKAQEALRAEHERRANLLKEQLFAEEPGASKFLPSTIVPTKPAAATNLFADDDEDDIEFSFSATTLAQKNAASSAKLDALFSS